MPISVQCPGCGKSLHGKDELAGKRVKCPKCGRQFQLPTSGMLSPHRSAPSPIESPVSFSEASTQLREAVDAHGRHFVSSNRRKAWRRMGLGAAALTVCVFLGAWFLIRESVSPVAQQTAKAEATVNGNKQRSDGTSQQNSNKSSNATGNLIQSSTGTALVRLLADTRNHRKEEKRGNLHPLPDAIKVLEHYATDPALRSDEISAETYSTQLNEDTLIERYGEPDEVGEESILVQDQLGLPTIRKSSRMLRYGWLRILVNPDGEVWAVKTIPERN